ncbi:MAG: MMPL family transporter [Georgenia sp.]
MAELLYRLGRLAARRSRTVIGIWVAVLALAGLAYGLGAGTLASNVSIPGTPTAEVTDRLRSEFPEASGGTGTVVLRTADDAPFTDAQRQAVGRLAADAAQIPGVRAVVDPFVTEAERTATGQQLADGAAQLGTGRAQLETGQAQLDAGLAQVDTGQAQLDAARTRAEATGAPAPVLAELDAQQAALDGQRTALAVQQAAIDEGLAQLTEQGVQFQLGSSLQEMAAGLRVVSEDGSVAVVTVAFTDSQLEIPQATKDAVVKAFEAPIDGVVVDFGSDIAVGIPRIFGAGEAVGLVVAAAVLVIMLGSLVGAGLPLVTALLGVGIGALAALSLSGAVEMVSVTPVLGIMLGLAVGIDYTLFIVNRHRRQLKQGYELHESIGLANGTSGNAVVFAGTTVFIALLALNLTGIPFLGLMGTVGAFCILVAVLIAVTLTPALLGLIGRRILSRRERARVEGAPPPAQAPVRAMSNPRAVLRVVLGVAGLLLLAVPSLGLRLSLPDGSAEPSDSTQYQAYATVAEKFGPGQNGPILVVADLPGGGAAAALADQVRVAEEIYAQDGVAAVAPIGTSADGTVAAFQVIPTEGPTSQSTENLVHTLRALPPVDGDMPIAVAGLASGNVDISNKLADALPVYLAVVVGLSLVIMIVVFRSIFVPVIATAGFILSYFAALGGVVAIYQWGWLAGVFGVNHPAPVLNFLPTILVGVLFGLAMDYMLFIGSGMREAYAHGAPARTAVVQGVRAGRSVVTAAAIIMVSVFGGFVFSESAMIRPIGFALALGVLLDAFIVRMWLVPALMHLAGDRAWWLPAWLDRILPNVDVEGASLERRHHRPGDVERAPQAVDQMARD